MYTCTFSVYREEKLNLSNISNLPLKKTLWDNMNERVLHNIPLRMKKLALMCIY